MGHYAFLDENNKVIEVITGRDENSDGIDWEQYYENFRGKTCKRTSYNTYGGEHSNGETPFRKNYAGIGFTYDGEKDAFIPPQPANSWTLVEETCLWEAPIPYPSGSEGGPFIWDEDIYDADTNDPKILGWVTMSLE